jgi:hypothetical protein
VATLLFDFATDKARLEREIACIESRLEETLERDDLGAYRARSYLRQLRRHKREQLSLLEHRRARGPIPAAATVLRPS